MSYAYRARKKAIKRLKKVLELNELPADLMPLDPHPPKYIGTLAEVMSS